VIDALSIPPSRNWVQFEQVPEKYWAAFRQDLRQIKGLHADESLASNDIRLATPYAPSRPPDMIDRTFCLLD